MNKENKLSKKDQAKLRKKSTFLYQELIGVILLAIGIIIFLSLVSYSPDDPSWATYTPSAKVKNYIGLIGASISEFLFQLFGLPSFLFPIAFLFLGINYILPKGKKALIPKIVGSLFLILTLSSLFCLLFKRVNWAGTEFKLSSGGFIGQSIANFLVKNLNQIGSIILLFAFLIVFLIITTEFSLGRILFSLNKLSRFLFKEIRIKITRYRKAREKEKMVKKLMEKYSKQPAKISSPQKEKKIKEKKAPPFPPSIPEEKPLFPDLASRETFHFPPYSFLESPRTAEKINKEELLEKKRIIEEKFREFNIEGTVVEYHPGPVITTFEYQPSPGVKISQVASLSEDLSLALRAESVRIERLPGKASIGLEVPNNNREAINLRELIQSEKFRTASSKLTIALGKTVRGEIYLADLAVMPHLLIAGATGTGKSVAINCIITSILYKATPEEVKFILIDPKRLELGIYNDIPYLLTPVVTDPKKANNALTWAIFEMENRYKKLAALKVRNIEQYNYRVNQLLIERKEILSEEEKEKFKPLPYLVIIIDELADLMMIAAQEVEQSIARLAQMARAVGIHLILATQRPSTDVITGTIKNNFPSRIAFRVPSKIDSRIIIDGAGAEKLLGLGDMLFMPPNFPRLIRLHGVYISEAEASRLIKFLKEQGRPEYDSTVLRVKEKEQYKGELEEKDELYDKAVELILSTGQASASYLQRRMKLGYARAARIIDMMEEEGIVGPPEGSKPREILVDKEYFLRKLRENEE
ncbi:MAG: DNA translocase FtsK [Candidatus Aminicenantia bacterium]